MAEWPKLPFEPQYQGSLNLKDGDPELGRYAMRSTFLVIFTGE